MTKFRDRFQLLNLKTANVVPRPAVPSTFSTSPVPGMLPMTTAPINPMLPEPIWIANYNAKVREVNKHVELVNNPIKRSTFVRNIEKIKKSTLSYEQKQESLNALLTSLPPLPEEIVKEEIFKIQIQKQRQGASVLNPDEYDAAYSTLLDGINELLSAAKSWNPFKRMGALLKLKALRRDFTGHVKKEIRRFERIEVKNSGTDMLEDSYFSHIAMEKRVALKVLIGQPVHEMPTAKDEISWAGEYLPLDDIGKVVFALLKGMNNNPTIEGVFIDLLRFINEKSATEKDKSELYNSLMKPNVIEALFSLPEEQKIVRSIFNRLFVERNKISEENRGRFDTDVLTYLQRVNLNYSKYKAAVSDGLRFAEPQIQGEPESRIIKRLKAGRAYEKDNILFLSRRQIVALTKRFGSIGLKSAQGEYVIVSSNDLKSPEAFSSPYSFGIDLSLWNAEKNRVKPANEVGLYYTYQGKAKKYKATLEKRDSGTALVMDPNQLYFNFKNLNEAQEIFYVLRRGLRDNQAKGVVQAEGQLNGQTVVFNNPKEMYPQFAARYGIPVIVNPKQKKVKDAVKLTDEQQKNDQPPSSSSTAVVTALQEGLVKGIDQALVTRNGGIDLNAANLDLEIKRDGKGMPLPVAQQNIENIHIEGLIPMILDIKPAVGSLNLL
ncbi:MAG: hypothetical protein HQL24_09195 [Candidatus Omnitrophica bacterium]|nr:hypothetical protein [Candidatus Omnitrophota bacterium]